jgi:hypothetical protein
VDRRRGVATSSSARVVTVREPEAAPDVFDGEHRGPAVPEGTHPAAKVRPIIDRTYSPSETPGAIRHLEEGHARWKVVITV